MHAWETAKIKQSGSQKSCTKSSPTNSCEWDPNMEWINYIYVYIYIYIYIYIKRQNKHLEFSCPNPWDFYQDGLCFGVFVAVVFFLAVSTLGDFPLKWTAYHFNARWNPKSARFLGVSKTTWKKHVRENYDISWYIIYFNSFQGFFDSITLIFSFWGVRSPYIHHPVSGNVKIDRWISNPSPEVKRHVCEKL